MTNRRSGVKLFLSVITAPIVLAHLINFLNRRCNVNPPASPIQNINTSAPYTIGVVMDSSYGPKFAALRLFVETMPIYNAVATGNRNNELYRETARSNWKQLSIATMPDYSRSTIFILTPLIFRYHLPLMSVRPPTFTYIF